MKEKNRSNSWSGSSSVKEKKRRRVEQEVLPDEKEHNLLKEGKKDHSWSAGSSKKKEYQETVGASLAVQQAVSSISDQPI